MNTENYTSKDMNHSGIVAGVCREIELVKSIDEMLGKDARQKVSYGEAVLAMIIITLGFVGRPLYLSPEFLKNKPIDILIRKGLKYEDFNDDVLGRTLDRIYEYGSEKMFMSIVAKVYSKFKRFFDKFIRCDTTAMSVEGEYNKKDDVDDNSIKITFGHPKNKRTDLKQFMIGLIMSSKLPIFIQAISGNTSDKKYFKEIIKKYASTFKEFFENLEYWVFDSAFFTEKNMRDTPPGDKWITRVPETILRTKEIMEKYGVEKMQKTSIEGYSILSSIKETYGGVMQRWILVFSEKAFNREKKTLEKNITKEKEAVKKFVKHFANRKFESVNDAMKVLKNDEKGWNYHKEKGVEVVERKQKVKKGKGRPGKEEKTMIFYSLKVEFEEDTAAIDKERSRKGKFIIATNELDEEKLSDERVFKGYKDQHHVERGFRFLKSPDFFADSIFLKDEKRIMAMVIVMGIALLVYSLAELKLREALEKQNETIPNQVGKPTKKPTMRRVFQMFEGINVLYDGLNMVRVLNLEPIHLKILNLLGDIYTTIYHPSVS